MARVTNAGVVFAVDDILSTRGQFIPAGTVWSFYQSSAPTGWTKSSSHNDKTLRVVSGSGGGSGGSSSFSSVFSGIRTLTASGSVNVGSTGNSTLSESQISPHSHPFAAGIFNTGGGGDVQNAAGWSRQNNNTGAAGGGGSHAHPGGGSSPIPSRNVGSVDLAVQYIDVIICTFNG